MSFEYIKRVCDSELELKLEAFGAVHIVGPKWCGKTACRGGWPSSIFKKSDKAKLLVAQSYFEGLCREDMSNIDRVKRNETSSRLLLRSYARNISTIASNQSIINDINADTKMSESTFYDYVKKCFDRQQESIS